MSTPGPGGPQPPEQDPGRSDQPESWGQQPPAGQPWGAPPPAGQQPPADQQPPTGQPWGAPPPGQPPAGQQPWGAPQPPGQQPPAGQQPPGQQPPGQQPWGPPPQPGQPAFGPPGGAQAFGQPAKPKRKWLPIVGGLVALLVVLGALSSFLGGGDPKIGDCVTPDGTSFKVVDCGDDQATAKIVGTDADMTGNAFEAAAADSLCTAVPSATAVLWWGTSNDKDGKVYCAESL